MPTPTLEIATGYAGGGFTVLVLKLIFDFINAQRKNGTHHRSLGTSGDRPTEFWQLEIRKIVIDSVTTTLQPTLTRLGDIMDEFKTLHKERQEDDRQFRRDFLDLQRDTVDAVNSLAHQLNLKAPPIRRAARSSGD